MKKIAYIVCILMCLQFVGCATHKGQSKQNTESARLVGNDRDEHGCIASAGYQWSELLKDCIRPFEKGVKLGSATDKNSTFAAYLVFNEDSTQVELFMHEMKSHPILKQKTMDDGKCWMSRKADMPVVRKVDGAFAVFVNGVMQYKEIK